MTQLKQLKSFFINTCVRINQNKKNDRNICCDNDVTNGAVVAFNSNIISKCL